MRCILEGQNKEWDLVKANQCKKCGNSDFGSYTSSSNGRISRYCRPCRRERADNYSKRKANSSGRHTQKEWLALLNQHPVCPSCRRRWSKIPPRPDTRYKNTWTKDHILPLSRGGSDAIQNIQPLCYQCQFKKGSKVS